MIILSSVLIILAAVFLLPTISDLISLVRPTRARSMAAGPADAPRVLVLIPAHDEELLIDACLDSLARLQYPPNRMDVLVVADNCTDSTAVRARSHGVRCLERSDAVNRGKPWAVAWAIEQITLIDFDAVIILDADTLLDPQFLHALAAFSPLKEKVVQGYIDISNPHDSPITRMAQVWSAVRFLGIDRVKARAGLNVPLGDGLCVGTQVLAKHGWTSFSLSETWELYVSMTVAGVPCVCAPEARLFAQEARSLQQSGTQRRRWTAGRLSVLGKYGVAVLTSSHIGMHQKLDCIGELTGLGPAAHLGAVVALAVVALALPIPGGIPIALALLASVIRPIVYTAAALARDPEPGSALAAFAYLPIYIVWRLGIQLTSVVTAGRAPWLRTARHAPSDPPGPRPPSPASPEQASTPEQP